jgi:hypothetical protein
MQDSNKFYYKIPMNFLFKNINPNNKKISLTDINKIKIKLLFSESIIYYDNDKSKYLILKLEYDELNHNIIKYKNDSIKITLDKSEIQLYYPQCDYQPNYIVDEIKVNDRINKLNNEINNINNILKEIDNLIKNNNINYKKIHFPTNLECKRFRDYNNNSWFSIILNNTITNDVNDLQTYIDLIENNLDVKSEKETLNKIKINISENNKNKFNNSDFNKLKKNVFIKYLLSVIKTQSSCYLNYLNETKNNILNIKKYDDELLFNDIVTNYILEINNNDKEKYGIFDDNLFTKIYYFKTDNVMAYSRNHDTHKKANGMLLAKATSNGKWNIFPCSKNEDEKITFNEIDQIYNDIEKIKNDTNINIFTMR